MRVDVGVACTGACGCGMSDLYRLSSIGERTPPWGTPVWRVVDVVDVWVCGFSMLCKLGVL